MKTRRTVAVTDETHEDLEDIQYQVKKKTGKKLSLMDLNAKGIQLLKRFLEERGEDEVFKLSNE